MLKIEIVVHDDGNVSVSGFPTTLMAAMRIMEAGVNAVVATFVKYASEGNLDANGTMLEPMIKQASKPPLILPS